MKHSNRGSVIGLALATSLLPAGVALAQEAAGGAAQPTQVEVRAHAIPQGAHCTYTVIEKLPVAMKNGLATVKGDVDGNKSSIVVDTGSEFSELGMQQAQKMGLTMVHTDRKETDQVGKETTIFAARVDHFGLGRYGWRDLQLEVSQAPERSGYAVGADVLFNAYQRDVEFSLANKEIKFFTPNGCSDAFLAYWDDNASEIPLTDLSPADPRQIVKVQVDGHQLTALIDSGSPHSVIDLAAAERIGLDPHAKELTQIKSDGRLHRHGKEWQVTLQSFAIGDETINRPRIAVADLWGWEPNPVDSELQTSIRFASISPNNSDHFITQSSFRPQKSDAMVFARPDMVLGADFLQAHRVLLAVSQQRMYFSYVGGRVFGGTAPVPETPQS